MYICVYVCIYENKYMYIYSWLNTLIDKSYKPHVNDTHSCFGATSTSEDRHLVRTRACGTALTGVYVHHIGTRVSILHTYTDTIGGGGTYCNSVRGAKMPSGSAVRSLSCRYRYLHTRAAGGEPKCLLLPVPACLRVLAGACLSIPIHPRSCTRTTSTTNHV